MQQLRQVLWIGGGSRSGKTTIAKQLARRHGLRWYGADAQTWRHRDRAVADTRRRLAPGSRPLLAHGAGSVTVR